MRVLLILPPVAGEGTQGALIARHVELSHAATGALMREHVVSRAELGRAAREHVDDGELVPEETVVEMLREAAVAAKAAGTGCVLAGSPRSMARARAVYLIGRDPRMAASVALQPQVGDAGAAVDHVEEALCPLGKPVQTDPPAAWPTSSTMHLPDGEPQKQYHR